MQADVVNKNGPFSGSSPSPLISRLFGMIVGPETF